MVLEDYNINPVIAIISAKLEPAVTHVIQ